MIQTEVWSHNVWAWMLEDPVEILDPVVGHLPNIYAQSCPLTSMGEEKEMVAWMVMSRERRSNDVD